MNKFDKIATGGFFTIDGEKMKKTGPQTYVSIENPILGEYTIQPYTDNQVVALDTPAKKSVAKKKRGK